MGNGRYLRYNRSLSTGTTASTATLNNNTLYVGSRYITLSSSSVSTTSNSENATGFTVTRKALVTTNPRYEITVSNLKVHYVLPETGGTGEYPYMLCGGLLLLAVFEAVLLMNRRKKKLI